MIENKQEDPELEEFPLSQERASERRLTAGHCIAVSWWNRSDNTQQSPILEVVYSGPIEYLSTMSPATSK